jgi:hypothetical protein
MSLSVLKKTLRNSLVFLEKIYTPETFDVETAEKSIKCDFVVYVYKMYTNNKTKKTNIPHYSYYLSGCPY